VHLQFGTDIAINAGNMMYYAPMLALMRSGKYSPETLLRLNLIYQEEMVQLHIGQGWDILWHNIDRLEGQYPTEDQYLQMTAHKTGVLARLSSRMVCATLEASEAHTETLISFVENMGVAFQIQDDILNLEGEEFKKTKGYNGEDIHEGKITLMVIHHLQNASNPQQLLEILKKRTENEGDITKAIGLLKSTGSIEYARSRMLSLIDESFSILDQQFPSERSLSLSLLKQLAEFGIKRQK
jgi:geranylgeranyl diphosphate synthase type 3/geranylgeranyl diphosphate synthase type I